MVKHILFVRLKDNSPEGCEKLREKFLTMEQEIDFIREIEVGVDFVHADRSYDVVLELVLDDREALDAYQVHPYHAGVIKPYVGQVAREGTVAVDYEY